MAKGNMMLVIVIIVAGFTCSAAFGGGDVGRYQAQRVPDTSSFFILDTQEGHIWLWDRTQLVYQGHLKPAESMGDVVEYHKTRPGLTAAEGKRLDELEEKEAEAPKKRISEDTIRKAGDYTFFVEGQPQETGLSPDEARELELLRSKTKQE